MRKIEEMPYINFFNPDDKKFEDLDFEFESKNKNQIMDFIKNIFEGKTVKDKYGDIIKLHSWEAKMAFLESLKNSVMFKNAIKNIFNEYEQEMLNILINSIINK